MAPGGHAFRHRPHHRVDESRSVVQVGEGKPTSVAGIVIAGGKGTRLGGDKPLRPFLGSTLLEAVIARAEPQVERLALNVQRDSLSRYRARLGERWDFVCDADVGDVGALAGVLAGMEWARTRGMEWLATFPSDTPFLPKDLVATLLRAAPRGKPAVARDESGLQGLCAVWPVSLQVALGDGLVKLGVRSLRDALDHLGGLEHDVRAGAHTFFNVNTPEDLAAAEVIAKTEGS